MTSATASLVRERIEFDVVIVGAGPAGLSTACRLAQLSSERGLGLSVAVVEKGAEVGAHIVSGAVIETRALSELFADWRERGAPVETEVADDRFAWLRSDTASVDVPRGLVPEPLRNHGNYIVSLGRVCRWLGEQAEALGCDILPGFAATEVLFDDTGRVAGVATGHKGIARDGTAKPNAEPGYALKARAVVFAEGCRGNLGQVLERRFDLRADADPQHYGLGFKEIWELEPARHRLGHCEHTVGWPLPRDLEGGGFVYHAAGGVAYVGFVVALNYSNPHLNPFAEFQRWKCHPRIRAVLEGGRRIAYGARAVNKGGLHSLPRLSFPGGLLVGCEAGFLNGAKIKGSHTAMKSGLVAAEAIADAIERDAAAPDLAGFDARIRESWIHDELRRARNFSGGISRFGTLLGGALAFVEHNVLRGRSPFEIRDRRPDHARLVPADQAPKPDYAPPDGRFSFDRLSSVYLASTSHDEDQPCHLRLADPDVPVRDNLPRFDEPAERYCPAAVYEIVPDGDGRPAFRINAANCVHCKSCEIKDPAQNITWVPPEGGSGPNYADL
jgi:electron-transferring-flavoprotein dehydrogenase